MIINSLILKPFLTAETKYSMTVVDFRRWSKEYFSHYRDRRYYIIEKTLSLFLALIILLSSVCAVSINAFAGDSVNNAEALTFGEEHVYHFSYCEYETSPHCWLTFTPESDGTYQFNFKNKDTKNVWMFFTSMYDSKKKAEKNVEYVDYDGDCYFSGKEYKDINPHFYTYTLKKGVTYYLDVYVFAQDNIKELEVPVKVTSHTHKFKDFFYNPVADEPGDEEEGEYGKYCSTCGYQTDIHIYKRPSMTRISSIKKGKKSFTASWKKVRGVSGYQIQYSTNKKFKKKLKGKKYTVKKINVKKSKTTKKTVKKLKAKTKYYVRVRTYKIINHKRVYSKWSKVKTVKT